jgi:hypothetical protein
LLARSLREQVTSPRELSIAVLFAADTPDFRRGYDLVREMHPDVHCQLQDARPLKRQIQDLVEAERREFFTFFVDDIVAVRPFGWMDREFDLLRRRSDVASLSLRLHPGVRYCQPLNISAPPPRLDGDRTWEWRGPSSRLSHRLARLTRKRYAQGDWAGSMFMDGYVFRHAPFIKYFAALPEIPYVTKLEPIMLSHPLPGHRVACYSRARIVNVVLNRVDQHSAYPHGGGSAEDINTRFLKGERLSYEHLRNREDSACHITVDPQWASA